jgi:hypothetical protein
MIWRRTVVLLVAAMLGRAMIGLRIIHEEKMHGRQRSICVTQATPDGARYRNVAQDAAPDAGFSPCFIDGAPPVWVKVLVLTVFFLWIGFFSSLLQDCFLYLRARRRGVTTGRFLWLR